MSKTLEKDGSRIDRASQLILEALNGDKEWARGKRLREAAELSQNTQVFYRVEEHLEPAGLVEEAARTGREGYVEPRRFRLTDEGKEWVTEQASALAVPATREETQKKAGAAYEVAESARSSVQNYRKKVSRVKKRVEELDKAVAEIGNRQQGTEMHQVTVSRRSSDNEEGLEELTERVEELERSIGDLEDETSSMMRRTREAGEERDASLREDLAEVRELAERANRSWLDRLLGR